MTNRNTIGRTPLDKGSARRGVLYLTIHNTHKRKTTVPSVGFEPAISAIERPHTYDIDWNDSTTQNCLVYEFVNWIDCPFE